MEASPFTNKISVRNGNLFEVASDLMVIPVSAAGTINEGFGEGIKQLGFLELEFPTSPGQVNFILPTTKAGSEPTIALAASVDVNSSKLSFLETIGRQLGSYTQRHNKIKHITTPLLGTGAGALDKVRAFDALTNAFRENSVEDARLEVVVLEKEDYKILRAHLAKVRGDKRNIADDIFSSENISLDMLSDKPVTEIGKDGLGFDRYATAIAGLIDSPETATPLTMAINAPWGAGKTSLGMMVKEKLLEKPANGSENNHIVVWFDAWMHDEATYLKAAFTAFIAREANKYRSLWHRISNPLPISLAPPSERRRRQFFLYLGTLIAAISIAVGCYHGVHHPTISTFLERMLQIDEGGLTRFLEDNFKLTLGGIGGFFFILLNVFRYLFEAAKSIGSFTNNPASEAAAGKLTKVKEQLQKLINQALPKGARFVIFIDDLERCRSTGAVELLETINQLVDHDKVITVIMADMPAVEAAAEIKYEKLAEKYNPTTTFLSDTETGKTAYGRLYIQKIIQLQFDLPVYKPVKLHKLLEDLHRKKQIKEAKEALVKEKNKKGLTRLQALWQYFTYRFLRTLSLDQEPLSDEINDKVPINDLGKWMWTGLFWIVLSPLALPHLLIRRTISRNWKGLMVSSGIQFLYRVNVLFAVCFVVASAWFYNDFIHFLSYKYSPPEDLPLHAQQLMAQTDTLDTLSTNPWRRNGLNFIQQYFQSDLRVDDSLTRPDTYEHYVEKHFSDTTNPVVSLSMPFQEELNQFKNARRDLKIKYKTEKEKEGMSLAHITAFEDYLNESEMILDQMELDISDHYQDSIYEIYSKSRAALLDTSAQSPSSTAFPVAMVEFMGKWQSYFDQLRERTDSYANDFIYLEKRYGTPPAYMAFLFLLLGSFTWNLFYRIIGYSAYRQEIQSNRLRARSAVGAVSDKEKEEGEGIDATLELFIKEQQLESMSSDSDYYKRARLATITYLGILLPRNAKRITNKLRLLLNIAHESGLLTANSKLNPFHFGKWVAIQEGWPDLAKHLSRSPEDMEVLEDLARENDPGLEDHLQRITPNYILDHKLDALLEEEKYKLSEVIEQLVYFEKPEEE